jgi:hypothetical protein
VSRRRRAPGFFRRIVRRSPLGTLAALLVGYRGTDTLLRWQSQPIFVTSTFEDMQAERDHLLTHVFPALEEWLATRRRHLEWVDLRVGVSTAEQDEVSRELSILSVCLDEVRRSRPFLIALIGDRYGWVPPVEPAAAAAAEVGFTTGVAGRSVTELEIDFGALHDPQQGRRSLVFLRAPLPYDEMPAETAAVYCDARATDPDAPVRAERLAQLKMRVRRQIPKRCFDYEVGWDREAHRVVNLEPWGRTVEAQLRAALEKEFTEESPPSDLWWMETEQQALADLVEDRTRGFVGRATALELLERTLDSPASEANPFGVCVLGGPGAGKSAVLGEVWKRDRRESTVTLMHAVDASTQGPSIGLMLRRFVAELAVHPDAKHWFRFTDTGQIWNRQVIKAARHRSVGTSPVADTGRRGVEPSRCR